MAKIAVEFDLVARSRPHNRGLESPASRMLACGDGWSVSDVICNAGPHQHPFEEQHSDFCVAIVMAGSFQYRSNPGNELMTPGSLFLGNAGQYFECRHDHAVGDRCISFAYDPQYFESLQNEVGARPGKLGFSPLRVPPVRELSRVVARACAGLAKSHAAARHQHGTFTSQARLATDSLEPSSMLKVSAEWEDIGVELAARALEFGARDLGRTSTPAAEARVTRVVRMIENEPDSDHSLDTLAREAKLSRYHFVRIFQQITGLTPHRYLLRTRLCRAATRLILEPALVLDIALGSGFGDVSNFNHAFRTEFGVNPRSYRRNARQRLVG